MIFLALILQKAPPHFLLRTAALPTELSWRPASIAKKEPLCQEGRQGRSSTSGMACSSWLISSVGSRLQRLVSGQPRRAATALATPATLSTGWRWKTWGRPVGQITDQAFARPPAQFKGQNRPVGVTVPADQPYVVGPLLGAAEQRVKKINPSRWAGKAASRKS